jgi:hypothetical protein
MPSDRKSAADEIRARSASEARQLDLRSRVQYDDARLLAECEIHTFRASGPGGQKRNKTSSAVRLHHIPSGTIVKAAESRSQHENKARALRRLREALAIASRRPLPRTLTWPEHVHIADGTLRLAPGNPAIPQVLGLLLDALDAAGGRTTEAAACLGISAASLTRVLSEHHAAWAEANRIRHSAGLPPLRARS